MIEYSSAFFRKLNMSDLNNSCDYDYKYSKGFDSCLFLLGEPLQLILLICTFSIFILLVYLFTLLIIAKKLLPKLMTEKHEAMHTFISHSAVILNHEIQASTKSYVDSDEKSQHSSSMIETQQQSE